MKALDSFIFFNSGRISGASQIHKHLQTIPYKSLPNSQLPIRKVVNEEINNLESHEYTFKV